VAALRMCDDVDGETVAEAETDGDEYERGQMGRATRCLASTLKPCFSSGTASMCSLLIATWIEGSVNSHERRGRRGRRARAYHKLDLLLHLLERRHILCLFGSLQLLAQCLQCHTTSTRLGEQRETAVSCSSLRAGEVTRSNCWSATVSLCLAY
jgi:hypothetical protein